MKKIRIVICDDHPLITEGIHSFITQKEDMEVVATAGSAAELMVVLAAHQADILLLDVNLPDENGIDVCLIVKRTYPEIRILGLSNFNERSVIVRMVNNGASGYLVKSESVNVVEQAIRHIYDGGVYFGKEAQHTLTSLTRVDLMDIPPITKREKEVLQYLDEGLTSVMIAEKMFISSLTVDSHRKNLLRKFNASKTISLVQKAKELGLI